MNQTAAMVILRSTSVEDTLRIGKRLGESLGGGITVALIGPLGAGKTHLVKGIAQGNGESDPRKITSPTFTLIQEYSGRLTIFHIDAYRLRGPTELLALGFDELVRPDTAVIVEWADRVRSALPTDLLTIEIRSEDSTDRELHFQSSGGPAIECLNKFAALSG